MTYPKTSLRPQIARKETATRRKIDPEAGEYISFEEVGAGRQVIIGPQIASVAQHAGKAAARGVVVAGYWGAVGLGWLLVNVARLSWAGCSWAARRLIDHLSRPPREDWDWSAPSASSGSVHVETNVSVSPGTKVNVVTNVKTA